MSSQITSFTLLNQGLDFMDCEIKGHFFILQPLPPFCTVGLSIGD